jgi:acyl transferase domain-containing protein/NADPH:quinone reductase-like Zn-dependent oxidoreductase/NAD(P)-dependent dehydrogenase (short-subunit alcohol dehydrogenase family)/acyl carrier protein
LSTIAIVGIGCRFPGGAHDAPSFWRLLHEGRSAVREIPPERWSLDGFYDAAPDNPFRSYSKWGGFLDDIASFDPAFFGLSRREAEAMDPQQRILLQVAYEAAEDAGNPLEELRKGRIGVFVGVSNTDYGLLQRLEPGIADIQAGTGTALSIVANRVSNLLDLSGPSLGVDTACSSSLVALDIACRHLQEGTADMALAGGVNILLDPRMFMTFCRAHMLSRAGRIAAFDAAADGFVRGEGAGLILLKRLDDALADGDRIYAVIKATAVNQDGSTDSITAPNPAAQKAMMGAVLRDAGIDAADIAYVEAHGTGTALGDPIEAGAVGAVFGQAARPTPVLIGSVKCNIGHLEPAAGIAGLIKTALILSRGEVPPSINFATPNPRIAFDALNIEVATRHRLLGDNAHALVNSFGFGGTNACAILARHADDRANVVRLSRLTPIGDRLIPVPLSAPTAEHLAAWARTLADALTGGALAGTALDKLSAALIRQRSHFDHRAVIMARNTADLAQKLTALADGRDWPKRDKNEPAAIVTGRGQRAGKLVFTCTGQGGQFWNMGRDFLESHPLFRRFVERFDALFKPLAGWSVIDALAASEHESTLHDPAVTPAAMFALQAGLAEVWRAAGVTPDIAIGHSFGEVTAAYLGGSIALADVAHLVNHRGLIRGHIDRVGAMAAIGLGAEALAEFLPADGSIEIGAYNAPAMVTVSGERDSIEHLITRLKAHDPDVLARLLDLDFAWHSSWLEPGRDIFRSAVGDQRWRAPDIMVISTVSGQPEARFDTDYWWRNLRYPVRFDRAVECALELGADKFIELGPSRTLSSPTAGCAAAQGRDVVAVTTLQRGQNNYDSFHAALAELYVAGHAVDWGALLATGDDRVALPSMPWLNEHLWHAPEEAHHMLHARATHVLLGVREPEPGWSWSSEVSLAEFPVLGDHRIMGACLLPGAAMISMLRAAAADIFGAQAIELSDVRLPEALFIGTDDRVLLRTQYDPERSRLRILSRPRGGAEQWTLRAEAKVFARGVNFEIPTPPHVDMPEAVDVAGFYRQAATNGYGFGPAFQGLRRITRGNDALRAKAALPSLSIIDDNALDPRLLDSCLQAIIAAIDDANGGPFLPERIERILIGGPLGRTAQVQTESRVNKAEGSGAFALIIFDRANRPCLCIQGLHAKAIDVHRAHARTPIFVAEELSELAPGPQPDSGHWLVLSGGPHGDALAESLAAQGLTIAQTTNIARIAEATHIAYALPLDLSDSDPWAAGDKVVDAVWQLIAFGQMLSKLGGAERQAWILTRNARANLPDPLQRSLVGAARALAIECVDVRFHLVDLDDGALSQANWPQLLLSASDAPELLMRGRALLAPRLKTQVIDDIPLRVRRTAELAAGADFVLRQNGPRSLDALCWQDTRSPVPNPGEVCVRVHAAGLNFRDVMAATGLLPRDAENGEAAAALGLEFCGTVESAGEGAALAPGTRVVGMARGALRRFLTLPAARLYPAPVALTDAEAACVPSVYLTVHYALSHLARTNAGDKVLVHSGAGGIGLAAVALTQRIGVEVYATAGSEEKRAYLKSLGVEHVMDSRSLDFADEVLSSTGGKGVDVVLNALPGAFIDKGLGIVAPYGHFVELGKRDVYGDRAIGLKALRKNVSLHVVDVAALIDERPALARQMMDELLQMFTAGEIKPPPVRLFAASQVADAFHHFSQGRHIGKIAIDLRDPDAEVHRGRDAGFAPDSQAAYLVTGGLSGFGFAIGQRLIDEGAGKVILASRSGVARSDAKEALERLRATGADVEVLAVDVTDARQVDTAIRKLGAGGKPLKGIIHAAVTYADAALAQMDRAKIEAVLATKVDGAINLTRAAMTACLKLDFFLSLSSLAQVTGWRGQSNYAAANAFLEALAHVQRAHGIPGCCLNLGMLGEAGFVARNQSMTGYLQSAGWLPITNDDALAAAAMTVANTSPALTFAAADWPRLRASETALAASGRLDALAASEGDGADTRNLMQLDAAARKPAALAIVRAQAAAVLRIDPAKIDAGSRLEDLGLDSLSSFELWNRIEAASATAIPLARFTEATTVDALAELLCALTEETSRLRSSTPSSARVATPEEGTRGDAAVLLPRERWVAAMRSARMTSDHGRQALETGLAVTVEPNIDAGLLGATWAAVARRHVLTATFDCIAAADFTDATWRTLDSTTGARLTCAQAGDATQLALRGSCALLDHCSLALLMQELLEAFAGVPARNKATEPWVATRDREIAELSGEQYLRHKTFWAEMLKDPPRPVYFARRSRALAPVGFGLNRGPTVRLRSAFARTPATKEAQLLTDFVQALARLTGTDALIVACEHSGRTSEAVSTLVGPLATVLPLVFRPQAERDALAQRVARDLRHAKAHAAFDLAACEDAFAASWRAGNIAPLQFGFSYRDDKIIAPALLAAPTCHFGSLIAHRSGDSDVIANDIRLSVCLGRDTAHVELAYDADGAEAEFAEALFGAFLEGRSPLYKHPPQPVRK